ncbi:bifunctional diaminohydroxyphosphoribosylaminopyrimidine deaminase/5-amino-6-(5-phosphoribosylamino)uracil reductase RibD, partial [candidate division WOR-3 bacterium]|nr:bifunctional diaminohydroxyphosphoribosylaminopyrimidine deaminase/5-amino-6-(5-phosphoribosylamino)uracil reductase RibD [candidate division WOR-3 bacterium]
MKNDVLYMKQAIELAYKGKGKTSPNPMVGAVIVKNGKVIGKGYHSAYGKPHAEIEAINSVKGNIENSEIYITLEPCNIHGKTPPCINTIEKIKFKRIIIGVKDPNPNVNGNSIKYLKEKGFDVTVGVLKKEIKEINPYYSYFMKHKKTFIIMKAAQTVNGYIAKKGDKKHYLSCEESIISVHKMRFNTDAILIGAGTINIDNPILDTRFYSKDFKPPIIILDFSNKLDYSMDILKDTKRYKYVFLSEKFKKNIKNVKKVEHIFIKEKWNAWEIIKNEFRSKNIISVLIEGGSGVFTDVLKNNSVNELVLFTVPLIFSEGIKLTNNIGDTVKIKIESSERSGKDIITRYK